MKPVENKVEIQAVRADLSSAFFGYHKWLGDPAIAATIVIWPTIWSPRLGVIDDMAQSTGKVALASSLANAQALTRSCLVLRRVVSSRAVVYGIRYELI
jgi:hypothetical protein